MSTYKILEYDPPSPNRDRFQDFIATSQYVIKLLYNKDYNPTVVKRTFTEKLTKHPHEGNMEYLTNLISSSNSEKHLVIAPTGSGKTFSINAIFQQLAKNTAEKQLLCLICPNRVQNIQNEASDAYSFEALIVGVQLEENNESTRQISAVYDKILDIRKFKKEHPEYRLRIVIDECQNLISANKFRAQAIENIMKLVNDNIADSYTFITATYESMAGLTFDSITLFEDVNYKPVFKTIDVRFAKQNTFEDLVMDTALKESKPYIRLNSKDMIKKVERTLVNMGQKCYSVTSDDKGYTTNADGTVTYNNIIFDHIVSNDDLYNNEGEADTILATSLLDAGTNFTKYSPDSTPVFAVFNPKLMNLDEIEQAFNRFRPQKGSNGQVIQLNHAIIIQQLPTADFTRTRIMKHTEDNQYIQVGTIPPKAIIYTDASTSDGLRNGEWDGYVTIAGKYFAELEDGKYTLELVVGDNTNLCILPLYVNCNPSMDTNVLLQSVENLTQNLSALQDGSLSVNTMMDTAFDLLGSLNEEYAMLYSPSTEAVCARVTSKPMPLFFTLTHILSDLLHQAKCQLAKFHAYKAADSVMQSTEVAATTISDVYIKLPSFQVSSCSHIKVSRDTGETIVYINQHANERIHFINDANKDLILIQDTESSISVSVFGTRYDDNGAISDSSGKHLTISAAPSEDEAEKAKYTYEKVLNSITITDNIHHFKIVLMCNTTSTVGGFTQFEYLESLLNMLKSQNPAVGDALYFTPHMGLRIDYQKLFNSAYSIYQNQYYYYPDRLMDELQKRLNIPVTCCYYQPEAHHIEKTIEDRDEIIGKLYGLYSNPTTKDILCSVLHSGKNIPTDLDDETRKPLAEIVQSNVYKKEYKALQKLSTTFTFDYIVKVLNCMQTEKETNKHIKKLEYMLINQAIERKGALPFSSKPMKMQFAEQSTLINIINEKRKATNTKRFTVNGSFMDALNKEFNKQMIAQMPSYKPKTKTQFKNLVYFVYIILNKNSQTRKPELTTPILSIDDIPLETDN